MVTEDTEYLQCLGTSVLLICMAVLKLDYNCILLVTI